MSDASNLPAVANDAVGDGDVSRIRKFDTVAGGQYWRTLADVPPRMATHTTMDYRTAERGDPGYIEGGSYPDQPHGRYPTRHTTVERTAMPGGRTYLVTSLRYADGVLHAVVLAPHPSEHASKDRFNKPVDRTFLLDEFFAAFERDTDPVATRDREMREVQGRIDTLQAELVAGPADIPLLQAPAGSVAPTIGALVRQSDQLAVMQARATEVMEVNKRRATWLQGKAAAVGAAVAELAPYYNEPALAALASVEDTMAFVNEVHRSLVTLGLYTGKDVEVDEIAGGERAPADEPATFFSNLLYLSEEYLVHLAQGGDGADWRDLKSFGETLAQDPRLVERILPTPRCVVLMQVRRDGKWYTPNPMENVFRNAKNMERFLLLRDGQRIHMVRSPVTTEKITHLFPIRDAHDAQFHGVYGEEITPEDLDWTKAKDKHEDYALSYKRVLILLWGLHDRLGLLGPYKERPGYTGFLASGFQATNFRFVHEDSALPTGRPPFREWVQAQNALLQSGSRVLMRWGTMAQGEGAPGYQRLVGRKSLKAAAPLWEREPVRRTHGDVADDDASEAASVVVARREKGRHLADIEVTTYRGWDGRRANIVDRVTGSTVVIDDESRFGRADARDRGRLREDESMGWLCLDLVKASDVDYYMESRINRRAFASYIPLFGAVREYLRADEAATKPFRDAVVAAAVEGRLAVPPGVDLGETVDHAIRLWRASRRGRATPLPGDADWAQAYATVLNTLHTLLDKDVVGEADVAAFAAGREPYRLVMTGTNRYALYASSAGDEVEGRAMPHRWVTRLGIERTSSGLRPSGTPRVIPMPARVTHEETLREWPGIEGPLKDRPPGDMSHATLRALLADVDAAPARLGDLLGAADPDAWVEAIEAFESRLNKPGSTVQHARWMVPVGVVCLHDYGSTRLHRGKEYHDTGLHVAYVVDDALAVLWRMSDAAGRRRIDDVFTRMYRMEWRAQFRSDFAGAAAKPPRIATVPIDKARPGLVGLVTREDCPYGKVRLRGDAAGSVARLDWKRTYSSKPEDIEAAGPHPEGQVPSSVAVYKVRPPLAETVRYVPDGVMAAMQDFCVAYAAHGAGRG